MSSLDIMEQIETIVENWQGGDIDSEDALEQITKIIDSL